MARKRNPNRELAYKLFKESKGKITCKDIAEQLNEKESNIKLWRREDKWINKGGAPKGNQNALGNIGNLKHGMYCEESRFSDNEFLSKYLPRSMVNVMVELKSENPLDILWNNILIQQAKILNMQNIIHVKNKKDITKVKTKESWGKTSSEEWEYQFAWDKENAAVTTLSKAMQTLFNMIKQYDEMLNKNWDLVTEEQKLRIEVLKAKTSNGDDSKEDKIDKYLSAINKELNNVN